jgi:TolB protein
MRPDLRSTWSGRLRTDRAVAIVAALVLALATSCTSEPERRDLPDVVIDVPTDKPTDVPSDSPPPSVASDVRGLTGRLAILDASGHLITLNPDGSREVVLAEVEAGLSQVRQPTWSPNGRRVAWVHLEVTEVGALSAVIATASGDGTEPSGARTAVVPFYLSWDPTSSRIAYLGSPSQNGIELGILEVAGRSSGTPLDSGQPFYLSWAPAGDELLVHVGEDRLARLGLDGSLTTVADRPGTFSVPVWTPDGGTFFYATDGAKGQRLVARDVEAETERPLVPFDGLISFVVSPDGERIAFQVVEEQSALPLSVIDVGTGETVEITDAATAAFFWSPDGERLLYLDPDEEQFWYRWGVWDGTSSFLTPRFVPSELIVGEYLQFFEQYAQSMSLWSPDGSAFAYPGMSEDGAEGIWIQSARPDRAPVLVADGDFVAWSPALTRNPPRRSPVAAMSDRRSPLRRCSNRRSPRCNRYSALAWVGRPSCPSFGARRAMCPRPSSREPFGRRSRRTRRTRSSPPRRRSHRGTPP